MDVLRVTGGLATRDDVKEAMTRIQRQSSKMKVAMEDVFMGWSMQAIR